MRREELERGKLLLILVHALNNFLKKKKVFASATMNV